MALDPVTGAVISGFLGSVLGGGKKSSSSTTQYTAEQQQVMKALYQKFTPTVDAMFGRAGYGFTPTVTPGTTEYGGSIGDWWKQAPSGGPTTSYELKPTEGYQSPYADITKLGLTDISRGVGQASKGSQRSLGSRGVDSTGAVQRIVQQGARDAAKLRSNMGMAGVQRQDQLLKDAFNAMATGMNMSSQGIGTTTTANSNVIGDLSDVATGYFEYQTNQELAKLYAQAGMKPELLGDYANMNNYKSGAAAPSGLVM